MLKRNIEDKINYWLKNDSRALLVYGVRQCGKTYIIRKCLKDFDFVEFNLINDVEVLKIFALLPH
jgi:predicted AAA+ superfamily ATPase